MTDDQVYEIPAGVVSRNLSGEMVILDLERGIYFGLNTVGTRIWELIGEGRNVAAIKARIVAEFDIDADTAGQDIAALVADLAERSLIVAAQP